MIKILKTKFKFLQAVLGGCPILSCYQLLQSALESNKSHFSTREKPDDSGHGVKVRLHKGFSEIVPVYPFGSFQIRLDRVAERKVGMLHSKSLNGLTIAFFGIPIIVFTINIGIFRVQGKTFQIDLCSLLRVLVNNHRTQ